MNKYLINQLKKGRLDKGLKQSDVTKLIGIKNTTLSNYENGITEPDMDTFMRLCKLYNLDYSTILAEAYGLQVPGADFNIKPSEMEHLKKYRSLDPIGQNIVNTVLNLEFERSSPLPGSLNRLPVPESLSQAASQFRRLWAYYGKIAASGKPVRFSDITSGTLEAELNEINKYADYTVGVSGDSMEPVFHDGDIVYVQKTDQINSGELGIFQKSSRVYIKEAVGNGLSLQKGSHEPVREDDMVICIGRVLGKVEGEYTLTT